MNNDPLLSYLGIARRAGYLAVGTYAVKKALLRNKAALVLLSDNISENTEKKLRAVAGKTEIVRTGYGSPVLSNATGTGAGIFAITDRGLAEAIRKAGKLHDEI